MRLLALNQDVIVFVSRVWQTTCTALRAGEEGFLIDSPVYPDELDALSEVSEQAGFPVSGLLATHGDWDHLLARTAFPAAALGCAQSTAARLRARPGEPQRELRRFDDEHYVAGRRRLALGEVQELPVPGRLSLGVERELELYPGEGHTGDGMAVWAPWLGLLVTGDYLSPVEIPQLGAGGSVAAYRATLGHLGALVERAEWVVPGHGAPLQRAAAQRIQAEDLDYLEALERGEPEPRLPAGRRSARQRQLHTENLSHLAG